MRKFQEGYVLSNVLPWLDLMHIVVKEDVIAKIDASILMDDRWSLYLCRSASLSKHPTAHYNVTKCPEHQKCALQIYTVNDAVTSGGTNIYLR